MTSIAGLFDFFLVLTMLWLAWNLLRSQDLFRAVVLFIIFGLLMVVAWVRLKAPDIALAEAAIGTGLTGALLLDAIGHMEKGAGRAKRKTPVQRTMSAGRTSRRRYVFLHLLLLLLILIAGLTTMRAVASLPEYPEGLAERVEANMALSGVRSAVTAVLLNFRGYDTLIEIGVMLIAVTGVISLRGRGDGYQPAVTPGALLPSFTRVIVPVGAIVAAFLLYEGEHAPGGAFQGGSVLAATLVLLRLSGFRPPSWIPGRTGVLMFAGFILFLFIAGCVTFLGNDLLEYPAGHAGWLIFLIETALAVSIAFILAELFSGWEEP
jgi:multisubunit Na+/H+ antiporter MnhB subunit